MGIEFYKLCLYSKHSPLTKTNKNENENFIFQGNFISEFAIYFDNTLL